MATPLARCVVVLCTTFLLSCGGSETASGPDDDPDDFEEPEDTPVLTSLHVSPESPGLTAFGATVQLTAVARDQNQSTMTDPTIQWSGRDGTIATVDADGLVTATGNGEVWIMASGGVGNTVSDSALVRVEQAVAKLQLLSEQGTEVLGVSFATNPYVETLDANGFPVRTDSATIVTVSLAQGPGTLEGETEMRAEGGRMQFWTLMITGAAGDHQLTFTADGIEGVTSSVFAVLGEAEQTEAGFLKNSNVGGVGYRSGFMAGLTAPDGGFYYVDGEEVTFSVGGVTLGTTTPSEFLTAIDLVDDGSVSSTAVLNISRFLVMLDQDGDPANGITVSESVSDVASDWSLDFTSGTFDSDVAPLSSAAQAADGGAHELPTEDDAQERLESTFRCVMSGGFAGTWAETGGSDEGSVYFTIDALTGAVDGAASNDTNGDFVTLTGSSALSADRTRGFVTGNVSGGETFSGTMDTFGRMSGTYTRGTWSADRLSNDPSVAHRYTGTFTGSPPGVFYMEIDSNNVVSGVTYSVEIDEELALSGSLAGTVLTFSAGSDGTTGTGTLDRNTGVASGNWTTSDGSDSGTWTASGCRVN